MFLFAIPIYQSLLEWPFPFQHSYNNTNNMGMANGNGLLQGIPISSQPQGLVASELHLRRHRQDPRQRRDLAFRLV